MTQIFDEALPALHKLKEQGKIRFYGVSGLPLNIFRRTLEKTELDVMLSYCHYSLNDTSLLDLLPLIEEKQVGLINASPLSMGLLSGREVPDWHPADDEIKDACRKAAAYCESKGADLAKLAVQFSVANERIPTTLVSTASITNIERNLAWIEEPMDQELLQEVQAILAPIHNKTWPSGKEENQ